VIDSPFSVRELAVELDAPYAAVQRLLEEENGRSVRSIDEADRRVPLWDVVDVAALKARIAAELGEAAADEPAEDHEAALARRLAAAEDHVLMALRSHVIEDAEAFALEALAALDGTELDQDDAEVADADLSLIAECNLPPLEGRAWIVGAIAGYLASRESAGLAGRRWRQAFRALAAVELRDQASRQKALLVELVRVVDERADGRLLVDSLVRAAEDADALERFCATLEEGEALWGAVATALGQHRRRSLGKDAMVRLCELAGTASAAAKDATDRLAASLRELAFNPDAEIARAARTALLATSPPRDVDFWRNLNTAQPPAPLALILEGLARLDLGAAFDLIEEIVQERADEVEAALVAALPALAREAPLIVEERFTIFITALPPHQRSRLATVPARVQLDWRMPVERPLAQRLCGLVADWQKRLDRRPAGAGVGRKLEELGDEIVALSRENLATLEPDEQGRIRDMLTERLRDPAGADVAVRALLAVNAAQDIVEALIRRSEYDTAETIARWYLDTLPRKKISEEDRKTLVYTAYAALDESEDFVETLRKRAAEIYDHLREFYDNERISYTVRARAMEGHFRARPDEDRNKLKEVAVHGRDGDA
jgi:hypothetical protein